MEKVYMICWAGRDADSDVWDDSYPCYKFGVFTSYEKAQEICDRCNKEDKPVYDKDVRQKTEYYVKELKVNQYAKNW